MHGDAEGACTVNGGLSVQKERNPWPRSLSDLVQLSSIHDRFADTQVPSCHYHYHSSQQPGLVCLARSPHVL